MNAPALLYNKTALDKVGIQVKDGMTIDEFVELSKEVKEKTGLRTNIGYNHETLPEYWLRAKGQVFLKKESWGQKVQMISVLFLTGRTGGERGLACRPQCIYRDYGRLCRAGPYGLRKQ